MVTWTQMYMPMGGLGLSALVALIPIIFFFVALAVLRLKGHVAGAITLILSILIAIFAFKMPIDMAFAAAGYGFIYGLWPIAWIIVAAVCVYMIAYRFYSLYIAKTVMQLDPLRMTPAERHNDGLDYVPTHKGVLFLSTTSSNSGVLLNEG